MEVFLKVTAYFGLVLIYQVAYVNAFQLPSSKVDIAKYSSIKATKTCSTGFDNVACNTTCPSRTNFPTMATPLKSATSTCTGVSGDSTIPNNANITNGGVLFNNTTCSSVNETYNVMKYFTISMWINVNCDNCNILEIANKIQVTSKTDGVYLNAYKLSIDKNTWTLVTIRYGTELRWSVNNASYSTPLASPVLSNSLDLMFGPNKNLSGTESLKIVDARFYHDALTMRERNSLYNGMFQLLPFHSECRCPSTHGELVQNTFPKQYMKCTNGNNQVSRFNTDSKMVEFLNDGDENTAWNSGETSDVTITIPLQRSFQLHQISLTGVTKDPIELKIIVYHGNQVRDTRIFREDCSAGSNTCLDYSEHVTSKVFSFTFDADISSTTTPTREQYKKTVADKIGIVVKTQDYFTVSEIKLLVRCDCGGNDAACTISGTKYTCNCSPASNTKGVNCNQCVDSYYRKTTALTCDIPCQCNLTGSNGPACEETSGNCTCKTNVSGRQCDTCMHNTANFSSTGCTACSCNSEGIQSCSTGLVCNCKNNVERDSGKCNKCVPNFYNLSHSDGCLPCDCFSSGTVDSSQNTCDETTGQCQCKSLVQGRQCNECIDGSYDLSSSYAITGCRQCRCSVVGSVDNICNKSTGLCTCKMERVEGLSLRDCAPTNLTLDPTYGPLSGGTKLTIKGHDLGEDVQLSFNIANEPQSITNRNNTHIFIETNPSSSKGNKSIKLYWVDDKYQDHVAVFTQQYTFEYREDPVIAAASRKPRKTYASGGCKMRLGGNDLNSVAYPKLLVYSSNIPIESPCTGEGNLLTCITPNLTQYGANNEVSYGLYFDNVIAYRNLSTIKILEDPSIDTGNDENYRNSFDDVFKITGTNLNNACHDDDVFIYFDDEICPLLSRSNQSISCDPKESFPGTTRTVVVKVKIGNWMAVWGHLNIKSFWNLTEFIYIVVGVSIFFLLVIGGICFVCIRHRRTKNLKRHKDFQELDERPGNRITSNPYEQTSQIAVVPPISNDGTLNAGKRSSADIVSEFCKRLDRGIGKIVKSSTVDRAHIEIGKICTRKGIKVRVVNGTYNAASSSPNSGSKLTIKTLIDSYPEEGPLPDWLNKGLAEYTRFQDFHHDNVMRMMGITVDMKYIHLLYPEMSKRSLKDYLSRSKEPLSDDLKTNIVWQTACGMNFLSAQGITHKDLAARNCWVDADDVVKVGDASFAYDLYKDEYFHSNGRYQPIRWMAPECLKQGFYDLKTDVWAFGVLVWEVYTNGYLPYFDITSHEEVKDKVTREHYRLGKPHNCSAQMFHVIEQCHLDEIEERPNFFVIQKTIESILNPDPDVPVSYVNDLTEAPIYGNVSMPEEPNDLPAVPPRSWKR